MTLTVEVSPEGSISSLAAARDYLRVHRRPGEDAVVRISPGHYVMGRPLWLSSRDSHTSFVANDPGDPPVFDGAERLTDWQPATVNGADVWQAPAGGASARSLFVNGARCPRPRHPRTGYLEMAEQPGLDLGAGWIDTLYEGSTDFRYGDGDGWAFHDLEQVEAVVPHYWVEERMPLVAVDEDQRLARSSRRSIFALRDDMIQRFARYHWDNVFEALGEQPGEWYFDRQNARVLYVPGSDDDVATFAADLPRVSQFVVAHGGDEPAREIRFEGLVFRNADWQHPANPRPPFLVPQDDMLDHTVSYASAPQAAANVDAAFEFVNVRDAAVVDCAVERVGGYAIELAEGCEHVTVAANTLRDLGGGGIKLHGTADDSGANRYNTVVDNEIAHGGQVFKQAVGILARHSAYNTFSHNEIHHLYYSGISTGWIWGYADNPSRGNLIEHNHIHHLGAGVLNDMGGVYVLGEQPGTEIRGNLIHDVESANYGGWGIYLDEGSSHVVIEGNVCHDVSNQCFHQHYGRENVVRGNLFAFGRQGQVQITKTEDHVSLTLERNVMLSDGVPAICGRSNDGASVRDYPIFCDLNLYWDVGGSAQLAGDIRRGKSSSTAGSWSVDDLVGPDEWMSLGHDRHSVIADPKLADPLARDFAASDDGPATTLGITVPDVSGAGVRSRSPR